MPQFRTLLQTLGAIAILALALACKGKSSGTTVASATSVTISGKVTYQRVPLAKSALGVPTGLADATVAANLQTLPARGAMIRVFQQQPQTQPDGTTKQMWTLARTSYTATDGTYSISVTKDLSTMVELLSSFDGGSSQQFNVVAEPGGISSTTGVLDRLRYALRMAPDGTAPAGVNTPNSKSSADATLNFTVGLNDEWWVTNPAYVVGTNAAPLISEAQLETTWSGRTAGLGSGSRILGIGDTVASFIAVYGSATPGAPVELHYWPGRSESRGSYLEYEPTTFPQAYDASTGRFHYFATLRGASSNDDAWDEGVILPILARNMLYAQSRGRTFAVPLNFLLPIATPLTDLSPDLARIEGLAGAMAANVLKSPYLADTNGTALAAPVIDIRDISALGSAQLTPYSAPALRALAWGIILKANSLPSPGAATDWASINPLAAARFFYAPTTLTNGATDSTARDIEPLNIYSQLKRLSETKGSAEPVDLAAVFTDAVLTPLTSPYGITWPRPTTGTYALFLSSWGTDPNSLTTPLTPISLTMANAVQVNGVYPNVSQGEIFYTGFSLSADKRYVLSATISPALGADARIDVDLPQMGRTFSFTGAGQSQPAVVFPVSSTAPFYHPVRVRLRSSTLSPPVTVTVAFTPAL